jgi:hypothetical protein
MLTYLRANLAEFDADIGHMTTSLFPLSCQNLSKARSSLKITPFLHKHYQEEFSCRNPRGIYCDLSGQTNQEKLVSLLLSA